MPGLEPQQLRVLVPEDLDGEPIEIRERAAVRCLAEVARVPIEDQALARHVGAEHERAEADDVRRRRGDVPCVPELAGVERRFQLVARQDDQVVEQAHARRERLGEDNLHGMGIDGRHPQPLMVGGERIGQIARRLLVVDRLEHEDDVGGSERLAVGEDDALCAVSACSGGRRASGSSFRPATAPLPGSPY